MLKYVGLTASLLAPQGEVNGTFCEYNNPIGPIQPKNRPNDYYEVIDHKDGGVCGGDCGNYGNYYYYMSFTNTNGCDESNLRQENYRDSDTAG